MKVSRVMSSLGWLCFMLMWIPAIAAIVMSERSMLDKPWSELDLLPKATVAAAAFLFIMTFVLLFGAPVVGWLRNRAIRTTGQSADALVLKIWDTGATINQNPVVGLALEVHPAGLSPFHAEAEWTLPRLQVAQLQPGAVVRVKYDPASHEVAVVSL